jgi:outer membrane protein assembly factor BamB
MTGTHPWVAMAITVLVAINAPSARAQTDWTTFGFDGQRTGYNPQETTLSAQNVSNLHRNWNSDLGGPISTQPTFLSGVSVPQPDGSVVQTDLVYVGTQPGLFYALNAGSGTIIWNVRLPTSVTPCTGVFPGDVVGIIGAPTIDRANGRIFVVAGDDTLHALDPATGNELAGYPLLLVGPTNAAPRTIVWSSPTYNPLNNSLYIATASVCDFTPYHGQLMRVDVIPGGMPRVARRWFPTGSNSGPDGGGIWGWGGASLGSANHALFVSTGNIFVDPENSLFGDHIVRLNLNLRPVASDGPDVGLGHGQVDVDFGSTPVLYQPPGCPPQLAAENKSGALFIYNRDAISAGPTQQITITQFDAGFIGEVAYDPVLNQIYVSNPRDDGVGTYFHGLIALAPQADCTLALVWQRQVGLNAADTVPAPPVAANGVVYFATGDGAKVFAMDATSGQALWNSGSLISNPIFAAPTVVNGQLFVAAYDNNIYAFGP